MADAATLPDFIALNSDVGRTFQTSIDRLGGGRENRNADWSQGRFAGRVGLAPVSEADALTMTDFFYAVQGMNTTFRWLDKLEYQGTTEDIGTGDNSETQFQLVKNHSNGVRTYNQTIKDIVSGSLTVYVNAVAQSDPADYSESNGLITFTSAPGSGLAVTATFQYYIPVRFDTDRLVCRHIGNDLYEFPDLRIIEVIE